MKPWTGLEKFFLHRAPRKTLPEIALIMGRSVEEVITKWDELVDIRVRVKKVEEYLKQGLSGDEAWMKAYDEGGPIDFHEVLRKDASETP